MAGDSVAAKLCVRCGVDVSGARRVKDSRGRYLCGECYDEALRERRGGAGEAASAAAAVAAIPVDNPLNSSLDSQLDDEVLDAEALLAEEAGAEPLELVQGLACPGCAAALTPDAAICVQCGYNVREGRALKTSRGQDEAAAEVNAQLKAGRDADRSAKRREQSRVEYTKAGAWCLGSLVISLFITASLADGAGVGMAVAEHLIGFGIGVLFATAVYFGCCLLWVGFDQPWPLIALKMGAVHALYGLIAIPLGFLWIFGSIIKFIVYVVLLQNFMDLELQDALIVAVLTAFAAVLSVVIVLSVLMSQGGII